MDLVKVSSSLTLWNGFLPPGNVRPVGDLKSCISYYDFESGKVKSLIIRPLTGCEYGYVSISSACG